MERARQGARSHKAGRPPVLTGKAQLLQVREAAVYRCGEVSPVELVDRLGRLRVARRRVPAGTCLTERFETGQAEGTQPFRAVPSVAQRMGSSPTTARWDGSAAFRSSAEAVPSTKEARVITFGPLGRGAGSGRSHRRVGRYAIPVIGRGWGIAADTGAAAAVNPLSGTAAMASSAVAR